MQDWLTMMSEHAWIWQAFLVIFGTLVADAVLRRVIRRVELSLIRRTRTLWDEAAIRALRWPMSVLVWILGITFAVQMAQQATGAPIFAAVEPLRRLGVVAVLAWFLVRFIGQGERAYLGTERAPETGMDRTTVDTLAKLLRISVLITAALVALQTLGYSISGVLAFGGIGGIAVGFAAKDLLANFFGGLMIYLDRPFAVGDWIRSPDREIEGTVEHISWRLTRIRTFDSRPLYVPNSVFSTVSVQNPSRMEARRIYETVGIRYDDAGKVASIVSAVTKMLQEHPDIDTSRTLMVNFNAFAPSSLDFFIYAFTHTRDWATYHGVKQDVLLRVLNIVANQGAEVAFPTSTLHLPDGVGVRTLPEPPPPNAGSGK